MSETKIKGNTETFLYKLVLPTALVLSLWISQLIPSPAGSHSNLQQKESWSLSSKQWRVCLEENASLGHSVRALSNGSKARTVGANKSNSAKVCFKHLIIYTVKFLEWFLATFFAPSNLAVSQTVPGNDLWVRLLRRLISIRSLGTVSPFQRLKEFRSMGTSHAWASSLKTEWLSWQS